MNDIHYFVFRLMPSHECDPAAQSMDCWFSKSLNMYFWSSKSDERNSALLDLKDQVHDNLLKMANDGIFVAVTDTVCDLQESLVVSVDLTQIRKIALDVCKLNCYQKHSRRN